MKKIYLMLTVVTIIVSCQDDWENFSEISDDENVENKLSLKQYSELLTKDYLTGSLFIVASDTQFTQQLDKSQRNVFVSELQPSVNKKDSGLKIDLLGTDKSTILYVGENKGEQTNKEAIADLFGRKMEYKKINSNIRGKGGEEETDDLYIPQLLSVNMNTEKIQPGSVISWNIDENNPNGIVIWIEYNAMNQADFNLAYDNRQTIRKGLTLSDKEGNYIVKQSDLGMFPDTSQVSVYIARAGFDFTEEDSNDEALAIIALTKVELVKKIKKQ